jgi:hypothetical protein
LKPILIFVLVQRNTKDSVSPHSNSIIKSERAKRFHIVILVHHLKCFLRESRSKTFLQESTSFLKLAQETQTFDIHLSNASSSLDAWCQHFIRKLPCIIHHNKVSLVVLSTTVSPYLLQFRGGTETPYRLEPYG